MALKINSQFIIVLVSSLATLIYCQVPGSQNAQNTLEAVAVTDPQPVVTVDDACLACICQASSECKPIACHVAGSGYFCGPYLISWAYWADAGKPGNDVNNPYAFEACLNNNQCAETTIRQYMAKNGRDCNNDNRITCYDIARIHKAGPLGCQNSWIENTTYWQQFLKCNTF